jgi:hypothetical protein
MTDKNEKSTSMDLDGIFCCFTTYTIRLKRLLAAEEICRKELTEIFEAFDRHTRRFPRIFNNLTCSFCNHLIHEKDWKPKE